jgi:Bacterial regulatory proteins, tetR family
VSGKRTALERFPQMIAAAVRVFTHAGYRAARLSHVAREAGPPEAALYPDPDGGSIPDDLAADTAVDALIHALVPPAKLGGRP